MAHHSSTKKSIRQTARRKIANGARMSRIRSFIRKTEEAIQGGDKKLAGDALRAMEPDLMRGVRKGLLHRNSAARKMSRLSARVKAL
jgi:small subunit ribosomal protein S20